MHEGRKENLMRDTRETLLNFRLTFSVLDFGSLTFVQKSVKSKFSLNLIFSYFILLYVLVAFLCCKSENSKFLDSVIYDTR